MNIPDAWLVIAEQFGSPSQASNTYPYNTDCFPHETGLCKAIFNLEWSGVITWEQANFMRKQVENILGNRNDYAYTLNGVCDTSPLAREGRCLAALWFALESEE